MRNLENLKNREIFVINESQKSSSILTVEKTNYIDFLSNFADETTTPRGVSARYFIQEREGSVLRYEKNKQTGETSVKVEDSDVHSTLFENFVNNLELFQLEENFEEITAPNQFNYEDEDCFYRYFMGSIYEAMSWGVTGNNLESLGEFFLEESDVEMKKIEWLEHDYENSSEYESYYETYEECQNALIERLSEEWCVTLEVAKSIFLKQQKCLQILENRESLKIEAEKKKNAEALEQLKISIEELDGDDLMRKFFENEIHPAPVSVLKIKADLQLSWGKLRKIYK